MSGSGPHLIVASERAAFKRCRREWDFGSRRRQNYEPKSLAGGPDREKAIRAALDVYYFPGMWRWNRALVEPLALEAFRASVASRSEAGSTATQDEETLRRYFEWARRADRFTPIRVETEFETGIPAARQGNDLVASDGRPVLYRGLLDVLVEDEEGSHWIVTHRFAGDAWAEPDRLLLDEDSATNCWAWELHFLGMTIAGSLFNELRVASPPDGREDDDLFRRTLVPRGRAELALAGSRLALEALEMTDPAIRVHPTPSWANCGGCAYRAPCIAMCVGADPAPILETGYRRRPEEVVREGQLGKVAWSVGRGARPQKFGEDEAS